MRNLSNVGFLSDAPFRFGTLDGVGAGFHDVGDRVTKSHANVGDAASSPDVFSRIVEESADGGILIAAVFKDQRRYGQ